MLERSLASAGAPTGEVHAVDATAGLVARARVAVRRAGLRRGVRLVDALARGLDRVVACGSIGAIAAAALGAARISSTSSDARRVEAMRTAVAARRARDRRKGCCIVFRGWQLAFQ
jgi:cobalamin biosynthesis protein CbiD